MSLVKAFQDYGENGYAVIPNFLSETEVENLKNECSKLAENYSAPQHCSVFHTGKDQSRDDYFINSGDKISYFFEKDAVDEEGNLVVDKKKALNKIGHALHWWNSTFRSISFDKKIKELLHCFQYQDPAIVQSMIIYKHPEIGGEVTPHQDSTFLFTEPLSTVGLWFPLVDINLDNGCLWFIPKSHKDGKIYQRYIRNPEKDPLLMLNGEIPKFDDSLYVPTLPNKGDCVVIHGSVIHKSGKNTTDKSRPVYTFHVIEKQDTKYSEQNWLQPTEVLPFTPVYTN